MRTPATIVLIFMLLLQGCGFSGLFIHAHTDSPSVIIEHPPNRLTINGDISPGQCKAVNSIIDNLQESDFKYYHYKFRPGLDIHIYDVENDKFDSRHAVDVN